MNQKYYSVQQATQNRADVYIFGDLVTPGEQFFEDETSGWSFQREIGDLEAKELHVHINSYGGAISEGWAIYNTLKSHPARVVTYADGFVASAAIYPFLAGEERLASPLSAFYFHQAMAYPDWANADDLRKEADRIEALNQQGLEAFRLLGIDPELILDLEKQETWMGAARAVELRIATSMMEDKTRVESQSARRTIMQRVLGLGPSVPPAKPAKNTEKNRVLALFEKF